MPYDANVLRRAVQRLEDAGRCRREDTERRRREAYAREPRLEQLDRRIQGTMAGLVAATLHAPSGEIYMPYAQAETLTGKKETNKFLLTVRGKENHERALEYFGG